MVTNVQLIDACGQGAREQAEWHKAKSPDLTEARLADFRAGYSQGWRAAISYLKLHGHLNVAQ
jgi:hypothetical protein